MIQVNQLEKTIGEKILFRDLSFTVGEKQRIGLIGVNGTGKSTLLKIMAGFEEADSGEILKPNDFRIGLLDQDPVLNESFTVLEHVLEADNPMNKAVKEYERALNLLNSEPNNQKYQEQFFQKQKKMDDLGAWDRNTRAKTVLTKLGLFDSHEKIGRLSGGQKKRVALAEILLSEPDLLLLDEPTNHLDYEMTVWLEEELKQYKKSVLFITHDRYFLDQVADQIFELFRGHIFSYKGNYSAYLQAKADREEEEEKQRAKKENLYRRELAWIKKGARARSTKQKARIQRFETLTDDLQSEHVQNNTSLMFSTSRLGKSVIEMKDCHKAIKNKVILNHFSMLVKPLDRIGITGKNGSGKTTFLNLIAGKEEPDSGEIHIGQTVKIAYYTQHTENMDENKRLIEYLQEEKTVVQTRGGDWISVSQMLERFLFPPHTHGALIKKLSGGEKKRLYLLKLLLSEPNVLLLDEPTNDFDTETLTILEYFLEDFPGVVITVSHDRYFLDKVCDQFYIFHGNGHIEQVFGSYSEYLNKISTSEKQMAEKSTSDKKAADRKQQKTKKMSYKEKMEWEQIEDKIIEAENILSSIRSDMEKTGSDYLKLQDLAEKEKEWNQELEKLMERWAYLSELMEQDGK